MKSFIFGLILILCCCFQFAQSQIPYGISNDTVFLHGSFTSSQFLPLYYYKPPIYDSLNSPIIIGIHGNGGNGLSSITALQEIADRRKALIVAPTIGGNGFRSNEPTFITSDMHVGGLQIRATSVVFKELYRKVLQMENRDSIPVYLIGFSAGGQFVTRYLLFRQAYPDSMPLKMAVSTNPYYYTFPTYYYKGILMYYMCGFYTGHGSYATDTYDVHDLYERFFTFFCHGHVVQYYNENYAVLIGTGDTAPTGEADTTCTGVQGVNRYERARNFYNFCDSNAVNIGTTLNWRYDSVIGVGHDLYAMWNTKRDTADTSSIAEKLLFETPYHSVPLLTPLADFCVDSISVTLPDATVNFTNLSRFATSFVWDFGDSTTSTDINPTHTYSTLAPYLLPNWPTNKFIVHLTAYDSSGCSSFAIKRYYIEVKLPSGQSEVPDCYARIFPNPNRGRFTVQLAGSTEGLFCRLEVFDMLGKQVYSCPLAQNETVVNIENYFAGIYFYRVLSEKGIVGRGKIVVE